MPPARLARADLELAVELGRRMALALDNARLLAETRRALQQREEFLRIASHELRTPLASLRLSTQALLRAAERKRAVSPEIVDQSLRRMLGNTTRLERLTSELLDVTRIEQDRLALDLADVALDAIVRQSVEQLEPDLTAAGTPGLDRVPAPRSTASGIRRASIRWSPTWSPTRPSTAPASRSRSGSSAPATLARLAVIDRGIGIDPARRPYIFDRFERAVSSTSYKGLGLGLYIARSIVVAHGGSITVESEPGVGSTFTVTPPCVPPQQPAAGQYLYTPYKGAGRRRRHSGPPATPSSALRPVRSAGRGPAPRSRRSRSAAVSPPTTITTSPPSRGARRRSRRSTSVSDGDLVIRARAPLAIGARRRDTRIAERREASCFRSIPSRAMRTPRILVQRWAGSSCASHFQRPGAHPRDVR